MFLIILITIMIIVLAFAAGLEASDYPDYSLIMIIMAIVFCIINYFLISDEISNREKQMELRYLVKEDKVTYNINLDGKDTFTLKDSTLKNTFNYLNKGK